jgi:hypothetical protein
MATPNVKSHDGQAYYDRHIRPFVDRHGERNGPLPPLRYLELLSDADQRKPEAKKELECKS